ncbi:MAG: transglycosylase domain-containing protein [Syntrophobacteraceae bacterium]
MVRLTGLRIRVVVACLCVLASFSAVFAWKTLRDPRPLPDSLDLGDSEIRKPRVVDRNGRLLSVTYVNRWNTDRTPLHECPDLLRLAFIESEDRRFHRHNGVDWAARLHALAQNIRALRAVRGASTISEQVVRMLHPRPRTVWSRWIEGIEAARLEGRFSKDEILEFYLNQVPYAQQRRGVAEAARFYFDRDLDTLNAREILALVVLVRAPSKFDLRGGPRGIAAASRSHNHAAAEGRSHKYEIAAASRSHNHAAVEGRSHKYDTVAGGLSRKALEKGVARLAGHMLERGHLTRDQHAGALSGKFELARSNPIIEASHFVQHIFKTASPEVLGSAGRLPSTLDGNLQEKVRRILDSRLEALATSDIKNGAVLVVDNAGGEVLAWVSGCPSGGESGGWVDAVTTPRQPGSTLKPFLYALAMEMGWTPATLIDDSPLVQPVRSGLHNFHNYSRTYYGPLRLRDALGNSLNTPAVRAIQFTGTARFLEWLHLLGVRGLRQSADFYGQGLALGDGEVSLFELVQAYSVLARRGGFQALRLMPDDREPPGGPRVIMSEKTAMLVADILSDPQARRLEFGEGHLLRFPVRTAVKTGTSTDHRDCWAVGFTERHTVGVWMGNLDRRPTRGITGAAGPALVLRSVFAELNRYDDPGPPPVRGGLKSVVVCAVSGLVAGPDCPRMSEIFAPENAPVEICSHHAAPAKAAAFGAPREAEGVRLVQPVAGLQIAIDPRIPAESQAFAFKLPKDIGACRVEWVLDGEIAGKTGGPKFLWPLSRGTHLVKARLWRGGEADAVETPEVSFTVK